MVAEFNNKTTKFYLGRGINMATWIAHLRVAENILNMGMNLVPDSFVAGNIAPDAGVPNEDWSSFNPPQKITHWMDSERNIKADDFFNQYIDIDIAKKDNEYFSFVLGYYSHLLADVEWGKLYEKKKEEPEYKNGLNGNPGFIWRIKEDWYGQDFLYLKENQDSTFFSCFQNLHEIKDYLDYFPAGAFSNRFKYIREMYIKNYENPPKEFIYLSKNEMDEFVINATEKILKGFHVKGIAR